MARILIVEDEAHIAEALRYNLEAEDYEVDLAQDGEQAVRMITDSTARYELVLLDLMLPGLSGFEVTRRVRAAGIYVTILMLTAKDSPADVIRGLEEGADDYMTKPLRLDELLARIKGLLRRRRWDGVEEGTGAPRERSFGNVTVHFDRFEIDTPSGVVCLTTREMGLLHALIEREGEVVTRGELLEAVWGLRPNTQTRVIDSFIVRLRRYVEGNPSKPQHILSVRGRGYRFVA